MAFMYKIVTLFFVVTLFGCSYCLSQVFHRVPSQTAVDFVRNNVPPGLAFTNDTLPYADVMEQQVIETQVWGQERCIIGFYIRPYHLPNTMEELELDLIGYLYRPIGNYSYERILIDTFENEGGCAELLSVFFVNADKDTAREVGVLVKWPVRHYQIYGDIYETRIYDDISSLQHPARLKFMENVSRKVSGGFDGDNEETHRVARFKTAREVKAALKKMGY
jgi:hypothetical protein